MSQKWKKWHWLVYHPLCGNELVSLGSNLSGYSSTKTSLFFNNGRTTFKPVCLLNSTSGRTWYLSVQWSNSFFLANLGRLQRPLHSTCKLHGHPHGKTWLKSTEIWTAPDKLVTPHITKVPYYVSLWGGNKIIKYCSPLSSVSCEWTECEIEKEFEILKSSSVCRWNSPKHQQQTTANGEALQIIQSD